jgi:hypothetical protein
MVSQRSALAYAQDLPSGREHAAMRTLDPGLRAALTARVCAGRLNRALIAGEDPAGSRQLAARAQQLTAPSSRAALATDLNRLLWSAQAPRGRLRLQPHREAVCASASALGSLAALLAGPAPLYARGVAMLEELLSDGNGPAYRGDAPALARTLDACRAALGDG